MDKPDFSDWVKHDGAGGPKVPEGTRVEVLYDRSEQHLIRVPERCSTATWPGFFWRWKRVRVGWFWSKLKRVCDDPAYAPVEAYRFAKPRSTAVDRLVELAAEPYAPPSVIHPEGPLRSPRKVPA
jgi:hypothetical protein